MTPMRNDAHEPDADAQDAVLLQNTLERVSALDADAGSNSPGGGAADGAAGGPDGAGAAGLPGAENTEPPQPEGSREERIKTGRDLGWWFIEGIKKLYAKIIPGKPSPLTDEKAESWYYYTGYLKERRFPHWKMPGEDIQGFVRYTYTILKELVDVMKQRRRQEPVIPPQPQEPTV